MLDFSNLYHILLLVFFGAATLLHTLSVFVKCSFEWVFIPVNILFHLAIFTFIFLGRLELDFAVLVFMISVLVYVTEYSVKAALERRPAQRESLGGETDDL